MSDPISLYQELLRDHEHRSPLEVHRLLDAWQFEEGETRKVYLAMDARVRWHKKLPAAKWQISIEEVPILSPSRVRMALDAVKELAQVLRVNLEKPDEFDIDAVLVQE